LNNLRFLWAFVIFVALWGAVSWSLTRTAPPTDPKLQAVRLITLPDIALSTEAHFIRHRSMTELYEIFGLGPSLLPYFPSDFVYAPAPYTKAKGEIR